MVLGNQPHPLGRHPTRPAFPEGAVALVGEGTAFDPALILTFFLALLWTCWGAQS